MVMIFIYLEVIEIQWRSSRRLDGIQNPRVTFVNNIKIFIGIYIMQNTMAAGKKIKIKILGKKFKTSNQQQEMIDKYKVS